MQLKHISQYLESLAPLSLQESYDNSGLLIGSYDKEINKVLISLDITHEVMDEAIENGCELIIAHHPLIFKGLKRLNGGNMVEDLVIKAIKNDIALYAIHTNLDNVAEGVNGRLAQKIGLSHCKVLSPTKHILKKLVVFCPQSHAPQIREAILEAGGGHIGNYSHCSFNTDGTGSFKALDGATPFVGEPEKIHFEDEVRLETIVPNYLLYKVVAAMLKSHPYEEVAYDIYPLENSYDTIGAGMIGELSKPEEIESFLLHLKQNLAAASIRHSPLVAHPIRKVAICGGSGSFLMNEAFNQGADIFITGDLKYHDFFHYQGKMTLVDAGHYETEQFAKDLLFDVLSKKFPTFAIQKSKFNTNPISFL